MKYIDIIYLSAHFDMVYAHLTRSDRIRSQSHAIAALQRHKNTHFPHAGEGEAGKLRPCGRDYAVYGAATRDCHVGRPGSYRAFADKVQETSFIRIKRRPISRGAEML